MAPYRISTNNNKDLIVIIGSRKKLNTNLITGVKSEYWQYHLDFMDNYGKSDFDDEFFVKENKLVLRKNGIEQILNENSYRNPSCLYFEGDIDGDGENDYIISYGVKSRKTILYLSSEAKSKLIEPVAYYYSGYCC